MRERAQRYLCVIGRFGDLGYRYDEVVDELRAVLPGDVFPWSAYEVVFAPETNDAAYFWDRSFEGIVRGYLRPMNLGGLRALLTATYGFDTFSSAEGSYGKVLLRIPENAKPSAFLRWANTVFDVLGQHRYLEGGTKVSFPIGSREAARHSSSSAILRTVWMKATAQHSPKYDTVTQHLYLGVGGEVTEDGLSRKAHIFRRAQEPPRYESGRPQDVSPSDVAPFTQISAIVVRNGVTHSIHIRPDDVEPVDVTAKAETPPGGGAQ